jgi:hypothetical protein
MKIVNDISNEKINQISDLLYDSFKKKLNAIIDDKKKACNIINTNTRAKMYEKHGFNKEKEKKYGFLTKRAGFTSVFHMCKKL